MTRATKFLLLLTAFVAAGYFVATRFNINPAHTIGEPLDELNGVAVYYNGAINNTSGRRTTEDGYNLGLKFQCVEFVKRYYYERFNHKMPNAMGHADDLIVFAPWALNRFGHVAIVSQVGDDFIEVIQQNPGPFGSTRERFPLERHEGQWRVGHDRVQGWLRREPPISPSVST